MSSTPERWRITPARLRWRCDPGAFSFQSTDEVAPLGEIVGQARALKAIRLGLEIESRGYNIFITGMAGTGRTTTVKTLLEGLEEIRRAPSDICYVHNFSDPGSPRALVLPAGQGTRLRRDIEELVRFMRRRAPLVLEDVRHAERRQALRESYGRRERELGEQFEKEVGEAGFRLVMVQEGPYARAEILPVLNEEAVPLDQLSSLAEKIPEGERKLEEIRQRHAELTARLAELFRHRRRLEREARDELRELDRQAATPVADAAIHDLEERYPQEKVVQYLEEMRESLLADLENLRSRGEEGEGGGDADRLGVMGAEQDPFRPYRVNVVVDNSRTRGAPVILETNPTFTNLFGAVERPVGRTGEGTDEFVCIRAGSLLRANGGYLVIDATDILSDSVVWPALKRALKSGVAEIQNAESGYVLSPSAIKPEPVGIDVKVVLIGDLNLYHALFSQDEEFRKIFKVRADFDNEMKLNEENIRRYAAFVSKICREEGLLPFATSGVAAVVERGVRLAGRRGKISAQFSEVANISREASYWARKEDSAKVERSHVERAIREKAGRSGLVEEKVRELVEDGLVLIDTEGSVMGQVNGLTVVDLGDHVFGRPVRITATIAMGRAGVINIERESYLSGKTHDKGVLILAGYLRGKYAQDKPLTVSASLCFEQSYGAVDGDSASSAEVCAVLSSLADLPLRQDIAVTGSVNQRGDIQSVGGVNEKIESFYDLCRLKKLTGEQGVVIPDANTEGLMLRPDVVRAVEAGEFHVFAVKAVDEVMEILTGVPAGERQPPPQSAAEDFPRFPPGTVNARVDERLRHLAMELKYFGEEAEETGEAGPRKHGEDEEAGEGESE